MFANCNRSLLMQYVFANFFCVWGSADLREKFIDVAVQAGAFISPSVSIRTVSNISNTGVVAVSDISNATIVVDAPWTHVFTLKVADMLLRRFRDLSPNWKVADRDIMALALMQLASLDDDAHRVDVCTKLDDEDDDWVRCSEQRHDFNMTVLIAYAKMLWRSDVTSAFNRADLFPHVLFPDVEDIQENLVEDWRKLRVIANVSDDSHMLLADYRHAVALVQSRVHRVALQNDSTRPDVLQSSEHALVPIADFFNAAVQDSVNIHCDSEFEAFRCTAIQHIQKGQELLVQYASNRHQNNVHLMTNYGFSLTSLAGKHTITSNPPNLNELLLNWERYSTALIPHWAGLQDFHCLEMDRLEIAIRGLRTPGRTSRDHTQRNFTVLTTFSNASGAANTGSPGLIKSRKKLKKVGSCSSALSTLRGLKLNAIQRNSNPYFVNPRPHYLIATSPPYNAATHIFSHLSLPITSKPSIPNCEIPSNDTTFDSVFEKMATEPDEICHTWVSQPVTDEELGSLLPFVEDFGLLDDPEARYQPSAIISAATNRTQSALHYDRSHNIYTQLCGRKRYILYYPEAVRMLRLYPWVSDRNQQVLDSFDRCSHVDRSEYRLAFDTSRLDIILDEGQSLYVPPYWVRAFAVENGPSVSLSVVSPSEAEIHSSYVLAYGRHALNLTRNAGANNEQRLGISLYLLQKLKIDPSIVNQRALETLPVIHDASGVRGEASLCWIPEKPQAEVRKTLRGVLKKMRQSLEQLATGVKHITEGNLAEELFYFAFGARMAFMMRWCGVVYDFAV